MPVIKTAATLAIKWFTTADVPQSLGSLHSWDISRIMAGGRGVEGVGENLFSQTHIKQSMG